MNIICPQCGFNRELPPDHLPTRAVIATCPKCACRFRFSAEAGVLETLTPGPHTPDAPGAARPAGLGDDPLPPGAIVPGLEEPDPAPNHAADQTATDPEKREHHETRSAPDQEEEDIRQTAERAYAREAARLKAEAADSTDGQEAPEGNPWEHAPGRDGWFAAFYQTVMRVMFTAPRFFAALNPAASQQRALVFYITVCATQTVVERLWGDMLLSIMAPSAATDPQLEAMLALLAPQTNMAMSLLLRTALLVLQLYVFTGLTHLAYRFIVPDRASFSLVFQVMVYSSAPALLCIIPLLGSLTGMIWGFACMVVGCRAALRLTWQQTLLGFVPVCLVMGPMILQVLAAFQG